MNTSKHKTPSKGDRLKWTPLRELKPVKLTEELVKGKVLTEKDLSRRNNNLYIR
jgi:hypothetical protein